MGEMADFLMYEDPFEEDKLDWERLWFRAPSFKRCRYCGKQPLWWAEREEGWRLQDEEGNIHTCKKYRKEE